MSKCGNNDCRYHKYCEDDLMWYDDDITKCRDWIKPKPVKQVRRLFTVLKRF